MAADRELLFTLEFRSSLGLVETKVYIFFRVAFVGREDQFPAPPLVELNGIWQKPRSDWPVSDFNTCNRHHTDYSIIIKLFFFSVYSISIGSGVILVLQNLLKGQMKIILADIAKPTLALATIL